MGDVLLWALLMLAFIGGLTVILTRDVMRLALGLGAFFVAVAGLFAWFGFGFLALAEVFVYVGGILVLVLFAIMLTHRTQDAAPELESRHDPLAAVACVGIAAFGVRMLAPLATTLGTGGDVGGGMDALGDALLGRLLPQFEIAGLLLLAALVAVVSIAGGERK